MKKFEVNCTMTYNGVCTVEANSEEEALKYVSERLCGPEMVDEFPDNGQFGIVTFSFGDATADYANEID